MAVVVMAMELEKAFVVRFLTRRFIADYAKHERCYTVNTHLKGENISLELLDSGGHHLEVCCVLATLSKHISLIEF